MANDLLMRQLLDEMRSAIAEHMAARADYFAKGQQIATARPFRNALRNSEKEMKDALQAWLDLEARYEHFSRTAAGAKLAAQQLQAGFEPQGFDADMDRALMEGYRQCEKGLDIHEGLILLRMTYAATYLARALDMKRESRAALVLKRLALIAAKMAVPAGILEGVETMGEIVRPRDDEIALERAAEWHEQQRLLAERFRLSRNFVRKTANSVAAGTRNMREFERGLIRMQKR